MTRQRVRIGRDVRVVSEASDTLELEGPARLAPGRPVDIVLTPPSATTPGPVRTALVWSWSVVRVGRAGAIYRGVCRWPGKEAPADG